MAYYDLVIVGSGPAGMTAAIYAARANLRVLLLDKLAPGGQIVNTNEIQNYTGFGTVNGAELAIKMYEHTQELQVAFDYKTVKEIRVQGDVREVHCVEDDTIYECAVVILSTGTRPRMLHVENESTYAAHGISWCAICDGAACRGKDVVVVGGGNSAVEESLYLADIANSLTVVTMFDLTADPMVCDKLRAMENVTVYPYQDILGFYGDSKIRGIHFKSTQNGEERCVDCDQVFEYIGLTPTTEAFQNLGILNSYGYVETDAWMTTKIPGIFGAGDCISKNLRQVVTACSDGAIAAQGAAHYIQGLK
ncbi:MAG: FAD-dependent oxidoreductase [Lachnospiraceae bacterium]|nr:FAD-dependent oxidoreductase [Lachnospiraceae bacterium]